MLQISQKSDTLVVTAKVTSLNDGKNQVRVTLNKCIEEVVKHLPLV